MPLPILAPSCEHAWVDDPWHLALEVCLYCEVRRDDVETFIAKAFDDPPPIEVIEDRRRPATERPKASS